MKLKIENSKSPQKPTASTDSATIDSDLSWTEIFDESPSIKKGKFIESINTATRNKEFAWRKCNKTAEIDNKPEATLVPATPRWSKLEEIIVSKTISK